MCSDGLQDSTLTSGRVTFAGASGRLSDDADLTFATDTLTATKAVGSTSVSAGGAVDAAGAVTITANTITAEGATANASETAIAFGDATADGTVTVTGTTTGLNLQVTAPANTELRVTQTLPTSPSAQANAFKVDATGAGSAAFAQTAILGSLNSGYTGSALTYGVGGANATANTSTNPETGGTIGVLGYTSAGTTNIGGWFKAEGSGAVSNVGVFGFAKNSTTRQIGGWFTTGTGATANTALFVQYNYGGALPTLTNSAAIIDNTASAVDILTLRDNGTAVFTIGDGGTTSLIAGTGTGRVSVGGVLCKGAPAQATTGTSEEILATCTIPAATLTTNGQFLRVSLMATTAANTNNKRLRVRLGGIGGTVVFDTGAVAANNQVYNMASPLLIWRYSATVAHSQGYMIRHGEPSSGAPSIVVGYGASISTALAVTWANANDLVITGETGTAAGDLNLRVYSVEVVQ